MKKENWITCSIKVEIEEPIEKIWDKITNNTEYKWRTDLSRIEILDDNHFIEYTKTGFPTKFEITKKELYTIYEFNIENENIIGNWKGKLRKINENKVEVELIENIQSKKNVFRWLIKGYLKSQQRKYVKDLKEELKV